MLGQLLGSAEDKCCICQMFSTVSPYMTRNVVRTSSLSRVSSSHGVSTSLGVRGIEGSVHIYQSAV